MSCDEAKHYETMRFFFDGVELPESQRLADRFVDFNSPALTQEPAGPIWHVHEPTKACTNCHDTKRQSRFAGRAYLIAPVPKLCHDCHDDATISAPNVHGPVAVGQCLQCHNPHKTQVRYLLEKGGVPELCYSCHDMDSILSIPAHFVSEPSACIDCHDPHASLERPLLKEDAHRLGQERALGGPPGAVGKPEAQRPPRQQNRPAPPGRADPELGRRKQEIADIFYASMDLYRDGKLAQAREGFVAVLRSDLIPQAMATTILGYIAEIDKKLVERTK
jgi:predicted CXXCH cytochrome family protein